MRVVGFPNFWDGHFLMFHYLQDCRDKGHHGAMLAARGKGKSLSGASLLTKRILLGES